MENYKHESDKRINCPGIRACLKGRSGEIIAVFIFLSSPQMEKMKLSNKTGFLVSNR